MSRRTVRYGVVGVKGFSRSHIAWINRAAQAGAPVKISAAATIVDDEEAAATAAELARDGAHIVHSYDELLALRDEIDIVTLPVGIHLHAPLATKALEAGYPVYMEKPAAGTVDEVAALARAEKASGRRLFVGFQTLFQPSTWMFKRQLLDGLVGTVKKIIVTVPWSRPMSYYRRNGWAGKIETNGHTIYDCPMNNSSAHFLNTALFLAGASPERSAVPTGVMAELYRAVPVESADSVFARFTTAEGVEVIFNGTHCCPVQSSARVAVLGDGGAVHIMDQNERVLMPWTVTDATGRSREEGGDLPLAEVFERVAEAHCNPDMNEVCTIRNAGMHTAANQMAFMAAPIHDIPPACIDHLAGEDNNEIYAIRGMDEALETMHREGLLPSETGLCPWALPGGSLNGEQAGRLLSKILES